MTTLCIIISTTVSLANLRPILQTYCLVMEPEQVPVRLGAAKSKLLKPSVANSPHWLQLSFMGPQAMYEIAEAIYTIGIYKAAGVTGEAKELASLIHEDGFGAGFDPSKRINSVSIVCHVDDYRLPHECMRGCRPARECRHLSHERKYIDQNRLKSEFEHLLALVKRKEIDQGSGLIEVDLIQRNVRIDMLEEALETFADVRLALLGAGRKVVIR